ncbi:MAG: hypothetical protein WC455_14615 [Dehalococcoidia bacterium]|jgi:hypothetical protein
MAYFILFAVLTVMAALTGAAAVHGFMEWRNERRRQEARKRRYGGTIPNEFLTEHSRRRI